MPLLSKKQALYRVGQPLILFIDGLVMSILLIKRVVVSYHSLISTFTALSAQGPIESKDLVLLSLIGPPGSGKSTVCEKIVQNAARPWTRVCQVC